MIPDFLIDDFKGNCFVVHPSILPKHRGSSPISAALLAGDNNSGVSIVEISKGKFDAGKIFLQK
jgi:methionyl-tRNA formyltransferase